MFSGATRVDVLFVPKGNEGRSVRRIVFDPVLPGELRQFEWNAVTGADKPAPDGRYSVFGVAAGGPRRKLGEFRLTGHFFPVRGPHWARGWLGLFGAPRSDDRVHQGYDVMARCGTPLAAVRAGKVISRGYDPVLYGNFLRILGARERRSYFYSHLSKPALPGLGERVSTGETVGRVGTTGNAKGTGCHLHFEIRVRGREIDPRLDLARWDRFS
jgi:murein DD-endopeptidase MepM/ murein hydrolase activator NlpD